jgi:hypothetical protein
MHESMKGHPMARDDDRYEDDDEAYEEERPRRRRRPQREPSIGDDAGMRLLLPVGRSVWAIVAGYLGLFSLCCLPAPFAILFGVIAIVDIKKNPEKHGMGRAIFGIVMGTIVFLLGAIGMIASALSHR